MRTCLVHSGHGFSTKDVGDGIAAGLRANGVEVFEYPLHLTFEMAELLVSAAKTIGIAPEGGYPDPIYLGTMGIPGYAMAKRVDLVLFVHGLNVPASIPETLRRGGYRTALYCTESPYETDTEASAAQFYDVVFTSERHAPRLFTNNRPDTVHYLPHAYNPATHTPDGPRADPCDVFFCGTRYPERDALLSGVDWTGINVVDKTLDYQRQDMAKALSQIVENGVAASYYRSAKISLNQHRQITDFETRTTIIAGSAESLNPRAYEVPACGGFLLSDERAELGEIFGDSVPTYTDSASLSRLIRYYLAHEDERLALAGRQAKAVQSHSWAHRARTMIDLWQRAA
jgi:spore maturation protein CgeB